MSPQRAFPLVPRRRLLGLPFGDRRSLRRGTGSEVVGSRAYRRGDPISSIDWPASARLSALRGQDEFIVRQYVAEEAPSVVLVVDRRPSMALYDGSLPFLHKPVVVERVAEAVAVSAVAARAPVGLAEASSGHPRLLAPSRTDPRLVLTRVGEAPFAAPEGGLAETLALLAGRRGELPAGTFVFVVSDFLAPLASAAWGRLRGLGWDVVPVVVQDPTFERSFPVLPGVVVPYADPSGGRVLHVRLRRREAEARRDEHEARHAALLERMRRAGADPVVLESEEPSHIDRAFAAWADRRRLQVRRLR